MFDITSKIISAIDAVSLNYSSVDTLAPYVRDIQTVLSTFPNLPANFTGVALTKKWVEFFSEKSATYDLNETEMRQLKFDLENVMSQFNEIVLGAR